MTDDKPTGLQEVCPTCRGNPDEHDAACDGVQPTGLTDEQIRECFSSMRDKDATVDTYDDFLIACARRIEAIVRKQYEKES